MYTTDRKQLIDLIRTRIQELSTQPLDLTPNSNISKFIDIISITDDNLLFYISLLFNEVNLETAILPDTIIHFCKLTGIEYNTPKPAQGVVKYFIKIDDIDKEKRFILSKEKQFSVGHNIPFYPDGDYEIQYNATLKKPFAKKVIDGITYPVESELIYQNDTYYIVVNVYLIQKYLQKIELELPKDIKEYSVKKDGRLGYFMKSNVYYNSELLDEKYSVYVLDSTYPCYTVVETNDSYKFVFATELQGVTLQKGGKLEIYSEYTLGNQGNVLANTIQPSFIISDEFTGVATESFVMHSDFSNGRRPDNLIELKKNLHLYFISKTNIIAREPDLRNITVFSKDITEYSTATMSVSIAPELTVYSEVNFRNEILETSTVYLKNVMLDRVATQGIKFLTLEKNQLDFLKSENASDNITLEEKNLSALIPFQPVINENLNRIEYFYRITSKDVPVTNVLYSKTYSKDKVTTISCNEIHVEFNPISDLEYHCTAKFSVNSEDIQWFKDNFDYLISIKDPDLNVIFQVDKTSSTLEFPDENFFNIMFSVPISQIEPGVIYKLFITGSIQGELIYFAESQTAKLFEKLPLYSRFERKQKYYKTTTDLILSDLPSLPSFTTETILYVNDEFKTCAIVYLKGDQTAFASDTAVRCELIGISEDTTRPFQGKILSQTNDTVVMEFIGITNIENLEGFKVNLYFSHDPNVRYVNLDYSNSHIDSHEDWYFYDIYHVPVISLKSYRKLLEDQNVDFLVNQIRMLDERLRKRLVFGTSLNFKYLRTFGTIENIKYNTSVKYLPEHINLVELPLELVISLIVELDFTDSDVEYIKDRLVEELNAEFIQGKIRLYRIYDVLGQVRGIRSAKVRLPEFDIVYDYDEKAYLTEIYYYVPELVFLSRDHIIIEYATSGEI